MILHWDCINMLDELEKNSIDLIYLDPPFFTQKKQRLKNKNNKEYIFEDNRRDIHEYCDFMKNRLLKCKEVLSNTWSIFVHCDKFASHYIRVILDEVFWMNNFQSEIIWSYKRWSNSKKWLLNSHQNIYFYSKSKSFKFNLIYTNYSPTTNLDQIFQKRKKNINWKTVYETGSNGKPVLMKEKKGVPLSDVRLIPYLNPKAKERVWYPTQKPLELIEKIIELVTDEWDVVLDPFMWSWTTLVAAKLKNREYIWIDVSVDAVNLAKERLKNPIKTKSKLLEVGYESYKNQDIEKVKILKSIWAKEVARNKWIDGFLLREWVITNIPIKVVLDGDSFQNAKLLMAKAIKRNNFDYWILIWNWKAMLETLIGVDMDNLKVFPTVQSFLRQRSKFLVKEI